MLIDADVSVCFSYSENVQLDDAVHTALLTLRESFEVGLTEDNVEVGICQKDGFKLLSKQQIRDHISAL